MKLDRVEKVNEVTESSEKVEILVSNKRDYFK
jgi:hypothetical protein